MLAARPLCPPTSSPERHFVRHHLGRCEADRYCSHVFGGSPSPMRWRRSRASCDAASLPSGSRVGAKKPRYMEGCSATSLAVFIREPLPVSNCFLGKTKKHLFGLWPHSFPKDAFGFFIGKSWFAGPKPYSQEEVRFSHRHQIFLSKNPKDSVLRVWLGKLGFGLEEQSVAVECVLTSNLNTFY